MLLAFHDVAQHLRLLTENASVLRVMVIAVLGIGFREALRYRVVPHVLMQAWFLASALITILGTSLVVHAVDLMCVIGVPRRLSERLNVLLLCCAFRACCWMNPQIRMTLRMDDADGEGRPLQWSDVPTHGITVVLNHTSFWDVFVFIQLVPLRHLLNTRTLMKDSLRSIPIFGGVFDRVGHFPVYFKSNEDGDFEVDKRRQAEVQRRVDLHIREGGNIAIFPEGAVNRHAEQLQAFRFGTFATVVKHSMPLYYMVAVGNEKTWPARSRFGGRPADIVVRFGRYPVDFRNSDSRQLAATMQSFMQHVNAEIRAGDRRRLRHEDAHQAGVASAQ